MTTTVGSRHHLTLQSPLPPQTVSLTVTDTKCSKFDITSCIIEHYKDHPCNTILIITGSEIVLIEVTMGVHIKRHDMANRHEEADVIMVHRVMSAARQGRQTIHIVCDDTDVFVLLIHFYKTLQITNQIIMVPTSLNRTVANIGDTVKKHDNIVEHILCDFIH